MKLAALEIRRARKLAAIFFSILVSGRQLASEHFTNVDSWQIRYDKGCLKEGDDRVVAHAWIISAGDKSS
ncbi:hypothetical protein TRP66_13860 [Pseudomonas sp. JDS28PS106]|uniref:hypothetical protein n=1 Tax=Pseudomonas sp. JDS28PS106 TaxID=2497235 RepID=UPI002FCEAAB0